MDGYLLFGGLTYYPNGGWEDFRGQFDTVEEAAEFAKSRTEEFIDFDWWHVVSVSSGFIVMTNNDETA